ncbi:MAG: WD40 repeat domain-containing protein [Candidatus Brocadiia bacterium]
MRTAVAATLLLALGLSAAFGEVVASTQVGKAAAALTEALTTDTAEAWETAISSCKAAAADRAHSPDGPAAAELYRKALSLSLRPQDLSDFLALASGQPGYSSTKLNAPVESFSFSSDGRLLAVAYATGAVEVLSATNLAPLCKLNGNWDRCRRVLFSPDGTNVIIDCEAMDVPMFEIPSGKLIRTFGTSAPAGAVEVSPDWTRVAISSSPGAKETEYIVFEPRSGRLLMKATSDDYITRALLFLSTDNRLVTFGSNKDPYYSLRVFDVVNGEQVARPPTGSGHMSSLCIFRLYEFPGSKSLVAFGDGAIYQFDLVTFEEKSCVWDKFPVFVTADTQKESLTIVAREGIFRWSPGMEESAELLKQDGLDFATATPDGEATAYIAKGRTFFRGTDNDGYREIPGAAAKNLAFSPDGQSLYISYDTGALSAIMVGYSLDQKVLSAYYAKHPVAKYSPRRLHNEALAESRKEKPDTAAIQVCLISWLKRAIVEGRSDEAQLACDAMLSFSGIFGPSEGLVRAVASEQRRKMTAKVGNGPVMQLCMNTKSQCISSVCGDGTIGILNPATGRLEIQEKVPSTVAAVWAWPSSVYFSVAFEDGTVTTFDVEKMERFASFRLPVKPLDFSDRPCFSIGALIAKDGSVHTFNVRRYITKVELPEPEGRKVLISPDFERLVVLGASGTLYLWSLKRDIVAYLDKYPPESPIKDIAFCGAGETDALIALCNNGDVIGFDWKRENLVAKGKLTLDFIPTAIVRDFASDAPVLTVGNLAAVPAGNGKSIRVKLILPEDMRILCPELSWQQVIAFPDGTVNVGTWSLVDRTFKIRRAITPEVPVTRAELLPAQDAVVLGHSDGTLSFWNTALK